MGGAVPTSVLPGPPLGEPGAARGGEGLEGVSQASAGVGAPCAPALSLGGGGESLGFRAHACRRPPKADGAGARTWLGQAGTRTCTCTGAPQRPQPHPGAASEEVAGGTAPSTGDTWVLNSLARPAGLSHMRLELETRAPGLEHERARPGGPGVGAGGELSTSRSHSLAPRPTLASAPRVGPLDAHLEGQGQLPQGVSSRAHIGKNHLEFQKGRRLGEWPPPSLTFAPSTQPHQPPGTFLFPSHACCFPPSFSPPSTGTFLRDAHSPEDTHGPLPDHQCFLLPISASPAIIWILCSPLFWLVYLSMCLSSLSLALPPWLARSGTPGLKEGSCLHRNLDHLMYLDLTKASARKVV